MIKKIFLFFVITLFAITLVSCKEDKFFNDELVELKLWHYYQKDQEVAFNQLVTQFNETIGKEKNIEVIPVSKGYVNELANAIHASATLQTGSDQLPQMFMAYANTVYQIDKLGKVASLDNYLSRKELGEYISDFLLEGRFNKDESLKIFPIAKATELLYLNKTDWDKFVLANPSVKIESLSTIEGIIEVSEIYYNWCGKPFYGRDSMSNYFVIGAKQLGIDLLSSKDGKFYFNAQKDVIKKLWQNYYIPYMKGYFSALSRFRSQELMSGTILAYTGSSSSTVNFPDKVSISDDNKYAIEASVMHAPMFKGSNKIAVNQGAGIAVVKTDKNIEKSCVEFLKWFTTKEINVNFALNSTYMPVKKDAIKEEDTKSYSPIIQQSVKKCMEVFSDYKLYTSVASEYGDSVRTVLDSHLNNKVILDKEAMDLLVAGGMSKNEALAIYTTDAKFDLWYNDLVSAVNAKIA